MPRHASRSRRRRGRLRLLAAVAVVAAGCSGDDGPVLDIAEVTTSEVVQTVAAAAQLEPAGRVTVTAPLGGEIAELLVADGDLVESGDPLARLASDSIELQVAQAEAAVEAADALAAAAATAGMDFSPVVAAFRGQLDAVFPPLIGALRGQLDVVEEAADDLATAADAVPQVDLDGVDQSLAAARERVDEAEQGYLDARRSLSSAEAQTRQQAAGATAGQQAAAAAQQEQAELALEAARALVDDLTIVAPAAGVVELARGGADADASVPDLDELAGGMDLDALVGGATSGAETGPVAEGVVVGPGQPVLTIFDLSGFTARLVVDEIDVVEVEVGQPVGLLVAAFPDVELAGRVAHVALAPERQPAGGAVYPVTVELIRVPDDLALRVGLTASAEIEVRRVQAGTVVPTSALLRRGGDEVVHVVRDGIAREVAVEVVAIGDETAAVDGAVAVGDTVVTTGVELIADGDPVELGAGETPRSVDG